MSITYTSANKILDYNLGATAYTPPSSYWLGLSTGVITVDTTGTTVTEPSGGAYARVEVINTKATSFNVAATGALTNKIAIEFAESSASWGTITYVFLADAETTGNIYFFEALSVAKTVQDDTTVLFDIDALTFSMSN